MTTWISRPTRRDVMAGLGASALGMITGAKAAGTTRLVLEARGATLALRPGEAPASISELAAVSPTGNVRIRRGDRCEVSFRNGLQVPVAPVWRGLDGAAAAEPLVSPPRSDKIQRFQYLTQAP